ncbi:ABC transporter substrate-binding protein [Pseudoduganella namucuonensis]|uniref:Probable sugar-binding periplasmic protein n=1 Tax=Pseudoduganella namucuonensis TaxID=1035707 RepID=A0A1I7FFZ9_9BURK|nr:extracellular solute-binding protein [Pseudoduganella namucuonensis]SFU35088.1 carbohydrate ABC transporter substrate-binding protein, CUT1 family [Pseudoduganella namucuonensis]
MNIARLLGNTLLLTLLSATAARASTLVLESWRVDDQAVWDTVLIPAFERKHPGITVRFAATAPTEYDSGVAGRLAAGTAGDLISCRPFDAALPLYRKGHLDKLNGKSGMQYFDAAALMAWQTDDGKDTFCMPVASVIHGFFYNKKIFARLKLQPPATEAEFFAVLDAVRKHGGYAPLALGTAEQWEASQTVFTNIGPSYWRGEEGRRALVAGKAKFTDPPFVAAFEFEERLAGYLGANAATQTYADSQAQFAQGRAAVYPAGSWDIAWFNRAPGLELGVFAPPVRRAGQACQVSEHMDIGIGVNRKSKNKEAAYRLLAWLGSQEFADLYTNRVIGFFTLSNHLIAVRDPVAKQMAAWRNSCALTFRLNAQFLNRGTPSMESLLWEVNAQVLNGKLPAAEAARRVQQGFAKAYAPPRK